MPEQEMQHGQQQIEQLCSRPHKLQRRPDRHAPPARISKVPHESANFDGFGNASDCSPADQESDSTDTEAGSAEQRQHRPQKRPRGSLIGYNRPVGIQLNGQGLTHAGPVVTMANSIKHVELAATITGGFGIKVPKAFALSCFQSELVKGTHLSLRLVVDGKISDTRRDVTCCLKVDCSTRKPHVLAQFSQAFLAGHKGYVITGLSTIGQSRRLIVHLQSQGAREQAAAAATAAAAAAGTPIAGMLGTAGGGTTRMARDAAAKSVPGTSGHAIWAPANTVPGLAHPALNAAGAAACRLGTSARPSPSHAPVVLGTADTGNGQPLMASSRLPPGFNMENFRTVAQAFKQLLMLVEHLAAPDELMQRMQTAMLKFLDAEKQDPASNCIAAVEVQYGFVQMWVKRGRSDQVLAAMEELFKLIRMAGE